MWRYICTQMCRCGGTWVGKCAGAGGHGEAYAGGNKLGTYVGMWMGTGVRKTSFCKILIMYATVITVN